MEPTRKLSRSLSRSKSNHSIPPADIAIEVEPAHKELEALGGTISSHYYRIVQSNNLVGAQPYEEHITSELGLRLAEDFYKKNKSKAFVDIGKDSQPQKILENIVAQDTPFCWILNNNKEEGTTGYDAVLYTKDGKEHFLYVMQAKIQKKDNLNYTGINLAHIVHKIELKAPPKPNASDEVKKKKSTKVSDKAIKPDKKTYDGFEVELPQAVKLEHQVDLYTGYIREALRSKKPNDKYHVVGCYIIYGSGVEDLWLFDINAPALLSSALNTAIKENKATKPTQKFVDAHLPYLFSQGLCVGTNLLKNVFHHPSNIKIDKTAAAKIAQELVEGGHLERKGLKKRGRPPKVVKTDIIEEEVHVSSVFKSKSKSKLD